MISLPINSPTTSEEFVQNILHYLQQTYTNSNDIKRKQSEEILSTLQPSIIKHLPTILNVVTSQQISPDLIQSLLIFTLNSIKKFSPTLNKPDLMSLLQILYSYLIEKQFPSKYVTYLNKMFEESINNETVETNISILNDITLHIETNVLSNVITSNNYRSVSYVCEDILCSTSIHSSNCVPIITSQLKCCEYMLKVILNLFNDNNGVNCDIESYLNTVKTIFSLSLNLAVHSKKTYNVFDQFSNVFYENILPFAIKLLEINYTEQICIKMKTKIFRFIISLLSNVPKTFTKENPLFPKFESITKYCINLLQVSNTDNLILNIKNESTFYHVFFGQIMCYLTQIFQKFPKSNDKEIISYTCDITKNIIMPLLICQDKDITNIYNDHKGINYANYIYDVIKTQKNKDYKVNISKFITKMALKHIEYANYVIEYSFKLIEISIKGKSNIDLNINDYMIINPNVNDVHRIECALLMLCILYKSVHKNHKIVYRIMNFGCEFISILNTKLNEYLIIKQRLCLLISVYIEDFLSHEIKQNHNQIIITFFEFLFDNIFNNDSNKNSVGIYESFQTLKSISVLNKQELNIDEILNKYHQQLINEIQTNKNESFFELLVELTTSLCLNSTTTKCFEIISNCVARIINESQVKQKKKDKKVSSPSYNSNSIVNFCYNIISLVLNTNNQKYNYIYDNISQLEQILQPLYIKETSLSKNIFWEDLIILSSNLIKQCNFIPKIILSTFTFFQKYLKYCKEMDLYLFELLALCLAHDTNFDLEKDPSNEQICFSLFNSSMQMTSSDDISKYRAVYFIEMWITSKNNINLDIISKLLEASKKHLDLIYKEAKQLEQNNKEEITKTQMVLFNSFVSLQLLMFFNYPIVAFNHISFEDLIKYLNYLSDYEIIVVSQIRMLILGICNILVNNSIIENYSRMIPHLITIAYYFLKKLKNFERKKLKNKDSKEFRENIINSDDEENESEEDEEEVSNEENEKSNDEDKYRKDIINDYNEIDNRAMNKFQNIDEFKTFKESMEILKNKYTPVYNIWYDDFAELNDMNKFNDILYTTRIKIKKDNQIIDIPRKILKIKRSNVNNIDSEMSL